MYHLNILSGESDDFHEAKVLPQKRDNGRLVFSFHAKSGVFFAGEMTVEWLLFSLEYPEAFLHEYLSEYNSTPPQLSEKEMSTFFSLLFADIDRKSARSNDEVSKEEMRDNLLLSIALLVRHARLAYADILKMSMKYFYFYLENMEIILGTKSPEEKQSTKSDRIDSQALLRLKKGIF